MTACSIWGHFKMCGARDRPHTSRGQRAKVRPSQGRSFRRTVGMLASCRSPLNCRWLLAVFSIPWLAGSSLTFASLSLMGADPTYLPPNFPVYKCMSHITSGLIIMTHSDLITSLKTLSPNETIFSLRGFQTFTWFWRRRGRWGLILTLSLPLPDNGDFCQRNHWGNSEDALG